MRRYLSWGDPHWHPPAHLITAQLFLVKGRHNLTLAPRDLKDLLVVLLVISIDFSDGMPTPEACGFTEADINEAIDLHQHHYGTLPDW
ncbi:hypothetical protein ACFXI8_23825 [Streptomyces niveus]|uniref:hypothetical protein n=1 Tax=Streptomyces niveus TaxID=193462 RepID=UPI0036B440B7